MSKVTASVITAAASMISAKIVISDGRWDQWQQAFVKSLNSAIGKAKASYLSWSEDSPTYYILSFSITGGDPELPELALYFVDSMKTGDKYEFVYARLKGPGRSKNGKIVAYGDAANSSISSRDAGAVKADNSNDVIKAVANALAVAAKGPDLAAPGAGETYALLYADVSRSRAAGPKGWTKYTKTGRQAGSKNAFIYAKVGKYPSQQDAIDDFRAGVNVNKFYGVFVLWNVTQNKLVENFGMKRGDPYLFDSTDASNAALKEWGII